MGKLIKMPYRNLVRAGHIVKLPSGAEGEVVFVETVFKKGQPSKIVFVEPNVVWWFRWVLRLSGHLWYRDKEIDKLVLIRRKETQ